MREREFSPISSTDSISTGLSIARFSRMEQHVCACTGAIQVYTYGRVERESGQKRRGQLITAQSRGCSYSINYRGWCAIGVRIIDIVAALFTVASEFIDRQRAGRQRLAGWLVGWLAGWLAGWAVRGIAPSPLPPSRFAACVSKVMAFFFSLSLSRSLFL